MYEPLYFTTLLIRGVGWIDVQRMSKASLKFSVVIFAIHMESIKP